MPKLSTIIAVSLLLALAAAVLLTLGPNWRLLALVAVSVLIGISLQRASFGFSSAFRMVITEKNTYGLRTHALMLMIASAFFFPLLSQGQFAGQTLVGYGADIGIAFIFGGIIFGVGMQMASGCASGTLFTLGGGNGKQLGTLIGFVIGSTWAAAHMGYWWRLPALPNIVLQDQFGLPLGLALQLGLLYGFYRLAAPYATRPYYDRETPNFLYGPWPLMWGGVALALLNVATLLLSGRPWGETSAFALWGSKLVQETGLANASQWEYWQGSSALTHSVFSDISSVMDIGIIIGAMLSASIGGRFSPHFRASAKEWIAAIIGGTLMGYGARLASGCNIGAYFSAGASGSLSAWAWVVCALIGSYFGVKLRPFFGLERLDAKTIHPASC